MTTTKSALLAAILASSVVVALAHEPKPQPAPMKGNAGSMQLHMTMADGQKMPMHMTGDVDRDFAAMMIIHHQQALKMADVEIAHGTNPKLKAMAAKMRKDQAAEITQLERFK